MTRLATVADAMSLVRRSMKSLNGSVFTVESRPTNNEERSSHQPNGVYIRWTNGPSTDEVRTLLASLNITIADEPVQYRFVRVASFASTAEAVVFARGALKAFSTTKFSVGTTPKDSAEYLFRTPTTVYVRWSGGPSDDEVRTFLDSLKVKSQNLWVYFAINSKWGSREGIPRE
jgi:hypothetical protein